MIPRKIILILLASQLWINHSQALGQTKKKIARQIYAAVITDHYNNRAASIVVNDSTMNWYITNTNYSQMADEYAGEIPPIFINTETMDSSWAITLREAEVQKNKLSGYKIPIFKTDSIHIQFVKKGENPKYPVGDRISLSGIILIGRRAIVETGLSCGSLCGRGSIYFLEKKKGKWKIVSRLPTWES